MDVVNVCQRPPGHSLHVCRLREDVSRDQTELREVTPAIDVLRTDSGVHSFWVNQVEFGLSESRHGNRAISLFNHVGLFAVAANKQTVKVLLRTGHQLDLVLSDAGALFFRELPANQNV